MFRYRIFAIVGLLAAIPFAAQARENPEAGQWFLSPLGAMMDSPGDYDIGGAAGGGFGIGYGITDSLAGELSYLAWDGDDGDGDTVWVTGFWSLPRASKSFQADGIVRRRPHKVRPFGHGQATARANCSVGSAHSAISASGSPGAPTSGQ